MLIAVLIYLVIGALVMGGIYLVNPELINDANLDDIFFSRSSIINYVNGFIIFLAITMIWLPVFIAVIIKVIADQFN
jgi:hypothetical protein